MWAMGFSAANPLLRQVFTPHNLATYLLSPIPPQPVFGYNPPVPDATPRSLQSPPAERSDAGLDSLLAARNADPFAVLGPHSFAISEGRRWLIRFFQPRASEGQVLLQGQKDPILAKKIRKEGLFESILPGISELPPAASSYQIRCRTEHGEVFEAHDAYAFPFLLTEFDLYLMGEGRHYDTYEKLGAHIKTVDGISGVHFAVWAPSAQRVSVVGDFNRWDGRVHPMRARGSSGIWELFVPDLGESAVYKFEIVGVQG